MELRFLGNSTKNMVSNGDEAKSSLRFELAERKAVGWDTEEEVVRPHTVLVIVGT